MFCVFTRIGGLNGSKNTDACIFLVSEHAEAKKATKRQKFRILHRSSSTTSNTELAIYKHPGCKLEQIILEDVFEIKKEVDDGL